MMTKRNDALKLGPRVAFVILIVILLLTVITSFTAEKHTAFAVADDSNYISIDSEEDLIAMIDSINGGNNPDYPNGSKYVLTRDLSLEGVEGADDLKSIGYSSSSAFTGEFDGGGHVISGYQSTSKGFFRHVDQAIIHDLTVKGNISGDKAAGLVCKAYDNSVIIYNCAFIGTLSGANSAGFIRIAGDNTQVINCYAEATFAGESSAGFVYTVGTAIFENCVAKVTPYEGGTQGFAASGEREQYDTCYSNIEDTELATQPVTDWTELDVVLNSNLSSLEVNGLSDAIFNSWSNTSDKVGFAAIQFSVTYKSSDLDVILTLENVESGSVITTLTKDDQGVAKDGCQFLGWDSDADGVVDVSGGETFTVLSDATLVAIYQEIIVKYSVTYLRGDAESGEVPTDVTEYGNGDKVEVMGNVGSLSKEGYVFEGWDSDGDGVADCYAGDKIDITADVNLAAVFSEIIILATPTITSFDQGVLTWSYEDALETNQTFAVALYSSTDTEIFTTTSKGSSVDLSSVLLEQGKGSYYAKVALVRSIDLEPISSWSNNSAISVYAINTEKGVGTTLYCPTLALANTPVTVTAEAYTGYENLVISLDGSAIDGQFVMPDNDVTITTSATLVTDYKAQIEEIISSISDEFSVDTFNKVKEVETLLDSLLPEQRQEIDLSRLDTITDDYNQAIIKAQEDFNDVNGVHSVIGAITSITLASSMLYLAIRRFTI